MKSIFRLAMILCGVSAYPRTIDFARVRAIVDKVGAILTANIFPTGSVSLMDGRLGVADLVSLVGRAAQVKAMKQLAGTLNKLAQ